VAATHALGDLAGARRGFGPLKTLGYGRVHQDEVRVAPGEGSCSRSVSRGVRAEHHPTRRGTAADDLALAQLERRGPELDDDL
jgi:hypothetical protein